jgi:hypothetical protein
MSEFIQLSLASGIEEGIDPKQLPPGKLLAGENCRQDKIGRARKKHGTVAVTKGVNGAGFLGSGNRILSSGVDLAIFDATNVDVYSDALVQWRSADQPSPLTVLQSPLLDTIRSAELVDQAVYNGLIVTVYKAGASSTADPIYATVRELATGSVVLPPLLLTSGGMNPRVCVRASTGLAYVVWSDNAGNIAARSLNLATFALGGAVAVSGAYVASSVFDAQIVGSDLFVAGSLAAGANRIRLIKISLTDPTFATFTATDTGGAVQGTSFCVDASNAASVFVAYATSALTRIVTFNYASVAVTAGPTTLVGSGSDYVFVAVHDATLVLYGHCQNTGAATAESLATFLVNGTTHAISANSKRKTFGLYHPSKPWRINNRWYCRALVLLHAYTLPSVDPIPSASSIVVEIRTDDYTAAVPLHRHRATLENQTSWYSVNNGGHLTQPAIVGTDVYIAAVYRNREPLSYDTLPIGWNQYKLSIGGSDAHRSLTLGRVAVGIAGAPFLLDGVETEPIGFIHAPVIISLGVGGGGSGAMAAGIYQYVAVYEWRDARGVLHRSIPSPPKSASAAASGSITVKVSTTAISAKQSESTGFGASSASPVRIAIYRTTVGGGDFYRLTVEPLYQVLLNDPTVADVSLLDTKADTNIGSGSPAYSLSSQPQVYTVQELEDVPPHAFSAGAVHRNRFAGIGPDRRTIWMSKDTSEDPTVFPGFHEALWLVVSSDKYALMSLDERLILFGEDNIEFVEGDGPDATGGQNTWRVGGIQTDVGCANPKSLVSTPMGLMFQSGVDLMLLDRGLTIEWIGRSVEDKLIAFPTITSAVLVSDEHEVRFTCNSADGLTGIVLVYDYECKAWYVRKYYDADSASTSMPIADAALINGVYTMLLSSGRVYRETTANCLDAGARFVSMAVEMLVAPAGNQGWHRLKDVQVLGTSLTHHDLKIEIARDFGAAFEQTKTFVAQGEVTTPGPLEKARVTVARQKGQVFRVRVSDQAPTTGAVTTGEGMQFEGLGLWVGRKQGPAKVSAGRKG